MSKSELSERSYLLASSKGDQESVVAQREEYFQYATFPKLNEARVERLSAIGVLVNLFFFLVIFVLPFLIVYYTIETPVRALVPLIALFFISWPVFMCFYTVQPQEHVLVVFMGSLASVVTTPGLHWFPFIGRKLIKVPTSTQTIDIKKTTVVDLNGNPIVVAGVVTFVLTDTIKAAFDVLNYGNYLEKQAFAVLKRVCSMYPYECKTGKSLQSETGEVFRTMVSLLQEKADVCGATIISYELTDLQYAPEIAAGMLVRQQAQALVEARFTIVEGAVNIVTDAVERLRDKGIHFKEQDQSRMVSTLLAVICGDAHVTPTFNVSGGASKQDAEVPQAQQKTLLLLSQIAANTTPKSS